MWMNQEQPTQEDEHSTFSVPWRTRIEGKKEQGDKSVRFTLSVYKMHAMAAIVNPTFPLSGFPRGY